jgi:hypothetical protein
MTDRDQMQADIERALAHSRPKSLADVAAARPKPGETVVFPVDVVFSNLFEPIRPAPERNNTYFTVSFPEKDLPPNLSQYAKAKDHDKGPLITVRSQIAPVIVPTASSRCALDTTLRCAKANNIAGDRLLRGARIELLVRVVEFESSSPYVRPSRYSPGGKARLVQTLDLCGVRLNVDTMVDSYDEILAIVTEEMDMWREK